MRRVAGGGGRLARVTDALRSDFAADPQALRSFALEVLVEAGEASDALWYEIGLIDGDPLPVRWLTTGRTSTSMAAQVDERIAWPTTDPRVPLKSWDRSFVGLSSVIADPEAELLPSRLYARLWEPVRMLDQMRMVVCHRGEHVAWIGCLRTAQEGTFTRADRRRVAPLADALADALITARARERAAANDVGCDVLVDATGHVEFACASARRWLEQPRTRDAIREWARAADRGAAPPRAIEGFLVRWSRMYGTGGVAYLLHLEPLAPMRLHPSFVLSRTQREIGRLAAAGATPAEIAPAFGITGATVTAHIKQIYELLGIGSRAELGRVFADYPGFVEERAASAHRTRKR